MVMVVMMMNIIIIITTSKEYIFTTIIPAISETSEKGKKPECVMWSYLENKTMPLQVPLI